MTPFKDFMRPLEMKTVKMGWLIICAMMTFVVFAIFVADAFIRWGAKPGPFTYLTIAAAVQVVSILTTEIKELSK